MAAVFRGMIEALLYGVVALIMLSLGGIPFVAASTLHFTVAIALVLWFILYFFLDRQLDKDRYLTWFMWMLVWLVIQLGGNLLRLPFFETQGSITAWLRVFTMIFTGIGIYLVAREITSFRERARRFLQIFVILCTVTAVYFIFIFFTSGVERVEQLRPPLPLLSHFPDWTAFQLQPNNLVDLFIPGFFLAVSVVFYANGRLKHQDLPQRVYATILMNLCFACLLLAGIFFTNSRAGIIAFAGGLAFYFILFALAQRRRRKVMKQIAVVASIVVAFLLTLGIKDIVQELQTVGETIKTEAALQGTRSLFIGASWQLVQMKGVLGVGLGNFHLGWILYHQPPFDMFPARSYNDFLWLWAEMGAVGIFLFCGIIMTMIIRSLFLALKTNSYFVNVFSLAASASIVAIVLHAMVDTTLLIRSLFWLFCMMLGVAGGCQQMEYVESLPTNKGVVIQKEKRYGVAMASIFVLVLAVVSGWYHSNQIRAFFLAKGAEKAEPVKRAIKLDPLNPSHYARLALLYSREIEKKEPGGPLLKAVNAIDEAIEKDPLYFDYYSQKAEIFLAADNEVGMRNTFKAMKERFPNFYLTDIIASAFYMNASEKASTKTQEDRFVGLALHHYEAALNIYPAFSEQRLFQTRMTKTAARRFRKLLLEKGL